MESSKKLEELRKLIEETIACYGKKYLTSRLIRELQVRLIYCSSLIEEEVISNERVREIVADYPSFAKVRLQTKEDFQAAGQVEALELVERIALKKELFDGYTAKEIHRLIMYRGWPDIAGKFRQENLELKGTSLLPPHYTKINEKMFFLNRFIEDNLSKSDTLEKQINFTARVHHEITAIHPFRDGNGRVARIFANLVLRYFDLPYVLIPKVKAKQEMRDALRAADMGDFSKLNEMETSLLVDSFKTINMFYQKRVLKNSESGVSL